MTTSKQQITMIGGGNMGRAIASGLLAKGYGRSQIQIVEPDQQRRKTVSDSLGVSCTADFGDLHHETSILILAVKPQIMRPVVENLATVLNLKPTLPLIVSIAAGVTTQQLANWFAQDCRLIRVMPNTPAMVGAGASALFANQNVTNSDKLAANEILDAVGISVWVETESELDAVTALSGSGPAYFFLVLESLEAEAVKLGLDASVARKLAIQTALGSAMLAQQSTEDLATLRRQVTSPGGTTERAVNTLLEHKLPAAFAAALQAANRRAKELAKESDG